MTAPMLYTTPVEMWDELLLFRHEVGVRVNEFKIYLHILYS
jgi:hypothetical protein